MHRRALLLLLLSSLGLVMGCNGSRWSLFNKDRCRNCPPPATAPCCDNYPLVSNNLSYGSSFPVSAGPVMSGPIMTGPMLPSVPHQNGEIIMPGNVPQQQLPLVPTPQIQPIAPVTPYTPAGSIRMVQPTAQPKF